MKVIMNIIDENGIMLFEHDMEISDKCKIKFLPTGREIKNAIKEIFKRKRDDKMNERIAQQRKFVEWLKAKGEYNALDSAATMQRMFEVWTKSKPK